MDKFEDEEPQLYMKSMKFEEEEESK